MGNDTSTPKDYSTTINYSADNVENMVLGKFEIPNVLGYSTLNPYVPPDRFPKSVTSLNYRDRLLLESNPFQPEIFTPMAICTVNWLFLGLDWTHHCYNNYLAVGTQMYPAGIYRYYDLFQLDQWWRFIGDWLFVWLCFFFR